MTTRSLFITSILILSTLSKSSPELPAPDSNLENDPLLNTTHLLNNQGVRNHLKTYYNAQSFTCTTADNIMIDGIYVPRNNATHTTIAAAGFYPGNQEGMASLVKLLPEDSNILFFDARGHGKSTGWLFPNLPYYGMHEYKDIIAVMDMAKSFDNKPLIMLGICAGGFNTLRALVELKKQEKLEQYDVRCVILDSLFTSGTHVLHAGHYHFGQKVIPQMLRSTLYPDDTSATVKDRLLYKLLWNFLGYPLVSLLKWTVQDSIKQHDPITCADDKIHFLKNIPILYIHANNDGYAPIEHVKTLKEKHANDQDQMLIFDKSKHAFNLLIHKHEYRKNICNFVAKIIATMQAPTM